VAKVSISEAARLAKVSRPTIYKMINSGLLSFTSVVSKGKSVKVIDTSEIYRVFGTGDSTVGSKSDVVINTDEFTPVNSPDLQDLQQQIALLKQENTSLKDAVSSREEHIASLKHAMLLIEHKQQYEKTNTEPAIPTKQRSRWAFWRK
jgi:hypothetical protein